MSDSEVKPMVPEITVEKDYDGYFERLVRRLVEEKGKAGVSFKHTKEKVQAPKIIPWFFKSFFESSAAQKPVKAAKWCPKCAADLDKQGHCIRNPSHTG